MPEREHSYRSSSKNNSLPFSFWSFNVQITYGETVRKSQPHLYVHVITVHQMELGYFKDMPELTVEEMNEIAEKIRTNMK